MGHHIVHIKASEKQLSKLRNGHKVRINPVIDGEGFNLIVHPNTFNLVSKSFSKGKGYEIQLSPEEIMANKAMSPEEHHKIKQQNEAMSGKGIFGKKFDDFVSRRLGNKAKDVIYNSADKYIKPLLKKDVDTLIKLAPKLGAAAASGAATASGNPELAPAAGAAGYKGGEYVSQFLEKYGKDYLDHPGKYQKQESNAGGPRNTIAPHTLQGQAEHNELLNEINKDLGTKAGVLGQANLENSIAHMRRARMNKNAVETSRDENSTMSGGFRHRREVSSIGNGSSFVSHQTHLPPALLSQPFSANFQFQHFLPPAYQKFSKGGGLYA